MSKPGRIRLEHVDPASLVVYERNPRVHSEAQITQLAAMIREVGFLVPVLLDDAGVLIAGHGRRAAALLLGLTEIPAIRARHLTSAQVRAMRIADNQLTLAASYDLAALTAEVAALAETEFDLSSLGFTDAYLSALVDDDRPALVQSQQRARAALMPVSPPAPDGDDDDSDEPDDDRPVTSRIGAVYQLGPHRLICGDSTDAAVVAEACGDEAPTVEILDPPFDVDYAPWEPPPSVRLVMLWARGATGLRWVGARVGDPPLWGVSTLAFSGQARGWARPEWPCLIHEVCYVLRRGDDRGERCRPEPARAFGLRLTVDDRPFSFLRWPRVASQRHEFGRRIPRASRRSSASRTRARLSLTPSPDPARRSWPVPPAAIDGSASRINRSGPT